MNGATEKLLVCPICNQVDTIDEFPAATGPARRFPVVRCARCSLVFQKYRPADEELEESQRSAYGRPGRRFNVVVESAVRLARSSRVRLATRLMGPKGRVLDVGCGRGLFVQRLRERGYKARGTELSSLTASNGIAGVPIDLGDLHVGQYPDEHFDLISIWHVLEHLRAPDEALRTCYRALRPGGSLLLAVPNYGSVQARFGGEQWFHLDLPRHLFHFTGGTLRRLLDDAGFETDRVRTGQWEMDPFGLLQTALNRAGMRHNALYDSLRNSEAARDDLSRSYRAALLALFPFGVLVATAASAILRLLGRAGTLIVVSHKPGERVQ